MGDVAMQAVGHGGAWPRNPGISVVPALKTWMPRPKHGMTIGKVCLVGALLAMPLGAGANAQPAPGWKQMTAKQLSTDCHAQDAARHAACVGYVQGIYDLQFAPTPPRGVCPPADFTPDLLAEVVMAYVDTHEDGPAPPAVGQAIVRFFPCAEQHR